MLRRVECASVSLQFALTFRNYISLLAEFKTHADTVAAGKNEFKTVMKTVGGRLVGFIENRSPRLSQCCRSEIVGTVSMTTSVLPCRVGELLGCFLDPAKRHLRSLFVLADRSGTRSHLMIGGMEMDSPALQ